MLIEARWLTESNTLLFGSDVHRRTVADARAVLAVFPMSVQHVFADINARDLALQGILDQQDPLTLTLAGSSMLRASPGEPGIARVILLCAQ